MASNVRGASPAERSERWVGAAALVGNGEQRTRGFARRTQRARGRRGCARRKRRTIRARGGGRLGSAGMIPGQWWYGMQAGGGCGPPDAYSASFLISGLSAAVIL